MQFALRTAGSYTGLRIGVSTAKGLCYALEKPLLSTNTLQTMAYYYQSIFKAEADTLLCPMIDARRMEVYYALFDSKMNFIEETKAAVMMKAFWLNMLLKTKLFSSATVPKNASSFCQTIRMQFSPI